MTSTAFTLFDTPIGPCGIAWESDAIVGLQLPEVSEAKARARLLRRFPAADEAAPPPVVSDAIHAIVAHLSGERADLSAIPLVLDRVSPLQRQVYEIARAIPAGRTLTYGDIAARLGSPNAAREVGEALGLNPFPIVVPCHRVVAAGGKLGGFSAPGGASMKLKLLALEGAPFDVQPSLFDGA